MKNYHYEWANTRGRSLEWLQQMLDEGFHIHHIDGDHYNDDPSNLALVYGDDHHKSIHCLPVIPRHTKGGRPKKKVDAPPVFRYKDNAAEGTKY